MSGQLQALARRLGGTQNRPGGREEEEILPMPGLELLYAVLYRQRSPGSLQSVLFLHKVYATSLMK
jgi:hypothetical protein